MKKVLFIIIVFVFTILSCTKEEPYPHPCIIFIELTFNTDGGVVYHSSDELVPKEIIENNLKGIKK